MYIKKNKKRQKVIRNDYLHFSSFLSILEDSEFLYKSR